MRLGSRASWIGGLAAAAVLATTAMGTGMVGAASVHRAGPTPGGTIVAALTAQSNVDWYFPVDNPANQTVPVARIVGMMWEPLLYFNNQNQLDPSQQLASKVTYNSQGTVYHVFLNPKWHWSDGTPITSADAVWSVQAQIAMMQSNAPAPWPSSSVGSGGLPQDFVSVVANGPYEFTITINKPVNQAWFIANGVGTFAIFPKHAWDKYPNNMTQEIKYLGQNATNPNFDSVVSGPFKMLSAIQNQAWTFVPNPNYSGHKSIVSKFIWQYEASTTAEFAGLKTGAIQIGYLPAEDWAARLELPDRMVLAPSLRYSFVWTDMNPGTPGGANTIFQNLYVRQAMAMAMNGNAMLNIIYHGQGTPGYGPFPAVPKTSFSDPVLTKPIYPYDPAKGKALLEAHGWQDVNGVMTKGSQQMKYTLQYPSGSIATTEEMELIQSGLAQEGIQITLEPIPFSSLVGELGTPSKWQMVGGISLVYGGGYPSGESLFYENKDLDLNGWNNPEENKLIQLTTEPSPSPAVTQQRMFSYFEYTAKELPAFFLPSIWGDNEVAHNIGGYNAYTMDSVTDGPLPQYWYVQSGG